MDSFVIQSESNIIRVPLETDLVVKGNTYKSVMYHQPIKVLERRENDLFEAVEVEALKLTGLSFDFETAFTRKNPTGRYYRRGTHDDKDRGLKPTIVYDPDTFEMVAFIPIDRE